MELVLSGVAVAVFALAAAHDLAWRRIPNLLAAILALAGLARLGLAASAGWDWMLLADLAAGLGVFAMGALAFHLRLLGGGDVKLLGAGALWTGAAALWPFLFVTALAGGVLALGFALWIAVSHALSAPGPRPGLPYGIAIAAGGILATVAGL